MAGIESSTVLETHNEYQFRTNDRVDLFFRLKDNRIAVVEIELEGVENLITGVHQAVKYRALAALEAGVNLEDKNIIAIVVAFSANYAAVKHLSTEYNVQVVEISSNPRD